jgi:hypothetical protein
MTTKSKSNAEQSSASSTDNTRPETGEEKEPVEEVKQVSEVSEDKSEIVRAMNVSATLLRHDDGRPFPPTQTHEITQAELERFRQAEVATGEVFIVIK